MGNYDYANESLRDTLRNNKSTAIGIGVFFTALVLLFGFIIPKYFAPETKAVNNYQETIRSNDIVRGNKDSKVTVVLYEDPQCPGCQALSKSESEKLESYRDRVRFVHKYIRVKVEHSFAKEANSYIYAAEVIAGKGYELAEKSYKTTSNPQAITKTEFLGYAKDLGLDITSLVEKANSKEIVSQVAQQDNDFALTYPAAEGFTKAAMRISGTPGAIVTIDDKITRITTGQDKSALVDPTKDFNASMISTYLEKYFNPNASSSTPAPTVETVPPTQATPAQ
jgi:Thioredoxin